MVSYEKKDCYDINDLLAIIKILRSENGCPWDKVQTHESIRSDFLEEVCEALEAIDLKDAELLREELGDVLLQVAFHCQIETEKENFCFGDVCDEVCRKLIIRHPHVFADTSVNGTEDVLENWDRIKKETKHQETYTDTLKSVAGTLPALMRAQKVGRRAMRAGLDFEDFESAFDKVKSEMTELEEAVSSGNQAEIEEEFGDLLFACTNAARKLSVDSESSLTKATNKFISRFEAVEEILREQNKDMASLSAAELDGLWNQVKQNTNDK